jgi:hypothetical protein
MKRKKPPCGGYRFPDDKGLRKLNVTVANVEQKKQVSFEDRAENPADGFSVGY